MSLINQQTILSDSSIVIEKKKRGRKKQNVVLEVDETPIEVVKPPPKKRGRKPKGGKIIQQNIIVSDKSDYAPSVILHLKCSSSDINYGDLYSSKYKYNPCIESIQSYHFDNSTTENLLIQSSIDTDINNTGLNNSHVNLSSTDKYNSTYGKINTDSTEQKLTDYCINSKTTCDNIDMENSVSCKSSNSSKNEIWEKLNLLKSNLHHNNIYDKRSACFWCTYEFDNPPIFIPKHEFKNSYQVYGCFCSPECAVAHLMNEKIDSSVKFERYQLVNHVYGKVCNYTKNIKPAPNPHYLLDKFYGTLSIKEYRDLFKTDQLMIVVEKPLTHVFPELYEDNSDFILNQRTIPSNTTFNLKKKGLTNKKTGIYGTMVSTQ